MGSDRVDKAQPYHFHLNAIALFGGLIDPLMGVFTTMLRLFRPVRFPGRATSVRRERRGLTLVLGGIEGPSQYGAAMVRGVLCSGYRGAVEFFPWNRGIPILCSLRNLTDRKHHDRQARLLVDRILAHYEMFPDAPVNLLAQSGGCWITVRALEMLPPDAGVHAVVLLAPSISPGYDIAVASSRCAGGLVSIGGPGDFFFLGLGTMVFGTSDRVHTPSAGLVGWHHHPPGFVEARWHPDWVRFGYIGNHTTTSANRFVRFVVVPMLNPVAARP